MKTFFVFKEESSWQFLQRLHETGIDCTVTFLYPATHHFRHAGGERIKQHYVCLEQIRQRCFDGLIITGAPVECLPFETVDYWDELSRSLNGLTITLNRSFMNAGQIKRDFGMISACPSRK